MAMPTARRLGIQLVLASAVLWSTAGLFVRMADMDLWSMVGWRSIFAFLVLGGFLLARRKPAGGPVAASFGWPGLAACAVSVIASITYIAALRWTSVANVMTVYATLPFVATGIAFVWLHDRVSPRFVLAGGAAFAGVAISVGAAMSAQDLMGIAAAFAMTAGCATQIVIVRRFPRLDTTLVTAMVALACFCIALPMMRLSLPAPQQLLACALYGVLTTGLGYILLLIGSRLVGAGEAGLLSMLDVVLGPFWVWLVYDERIALPVFLGGALVLASVAWYLGADRSQPITA